MGVPSFFRWLASRYERVLEDCVEEEVKVLEGVEIPVDTSKPNPNNQEFDNLYLDMNGIIHPCVHPENRKPPETEDEMFIEVFKYIDRVFSIVRPRRVLFLAIDGVAPRAKMNQQRGRRFKAAQEAQEKEDAFEKFCNKLRSEGVHVPDEAFSKKRAFDSNAITPGTPFMDRLTVALRFYLAERMSTDAGWKEIKVVFTDSNVPGEGEHKIMDFIRRQRAQPEWDGNTRHVVYGLDADLIMLALSTHEPHFHILREQVQMGRPARCPICNQLGHGAETCSAGRDDAAASSEVKPIHSLTKFSFLSVLRLREYLAIEYQALAQAPLKYEYDFERVIDDFVFLCFLCGNDFLPHLPHLEIRDGAVLYLMELYKKFAVRADGYLTEGGEVDLARVGEFVKTASLKEEAIFKARRRREEMFRRRERSKVDRQQRERRDVERRANSAPGVGPAGRSNLNAAAEIRQQLAAGRKRLSDTMAQQELSAAKRPKDEAGDAGEAGKKLRDRFSNNKDDSAPATVASTEAEWRERDKGDSVKLHESGWKERYYQSKFHHSSSDRAFVDSVVSSYVQGLVWTMRYYYQGCRSWTWFYKFHYAPFASDFVDLKRFAADCDMSAKTTPFSPFEQLMGVLPAASRHCLPPEFGALMVDKDSPIIDFYPLQFESDLNGKRFAWQSVVLLPWIDEERLLAAVQPLEEKLEGVMKERNALGSTRLFLHRAHASAPLLEVLNAPDADADKTVALQPKLAQSLSGVARMDPSAPAVGARVSSKLPDEIPDIVSNACLSFRYAFPALPEGHTFRSSLRSDVVMPPPVVTQEDFSRGLSKTRHLFILDAENRPQRGGHPGYGGGRGGYGGRGSYNGGNDNGGGRGGYTERRGGYGGQGGQVQGGYGAGGGRGGYQGGHQGRQGYVQGAYGAGTGNDGYRDTRGGYGGQGGQVQGGYGAGGGRGGYQGGHQGRQGYVQGAYGAGGSGGHTSGYGGRGGQTQGGYGAGGGSGGYSAQAAPPNPPEYRNPYSDPFGPQAGGYSPFASRPRDPRQR